MGTPVTSTRKELISHVSAPRGRKNKSHSRFILTDESKLAHQSGTERQLMLLVSEIEISSIETRHTDSVEEQFPACYPYRPALVPPSVPASPRNIYSNPRQAVVVASSFLRCALLAVALYSSISLTSISHPSMPLLISVGGSLRIQLVSYPPFPSATGFLFDGPICIRFRRFRPFCTFRLPPISRG